MNPQAGLSFDQAPPLRVPLRFFLTAPLFLLAAGLMLGVVPESLSSRWTPEMLALTHALTLGFLAMIMIGAMMQMLPVVAGATMPAARGLAWLIHIALPGGTLALIAGFLGAGITYLIIGAVLLAAGFSLFLAAASFGLARAAANSTVSGMRLAVLSLGITAFMGVWLALLRAGHALPVHYPLAGMLHIGFGLLGWIFLLVMGVAYQVVPMFLITPPYPARLTRWLAGAVFVLLMVLGASQLLPPWTREIMMQLAGMGLATTLLIFAFATLRLQQKRRRKLADVTLDFWRLGMVSLAGCAAVWLTAQFWPAWHKSNAYPLLLGVLFLIGFAASVVMGMLYKIVPFLAWFHLQAQLQARAGTIPNMKQMIAERNMRIQFWAHLAGMLLLAMAVGAPPFLAAIGGGFLALSALLLWFNLLSATRRFARHGGRFS